MTSIMRLSYFLTLCILFTVHFQPVITAGGWVSGTYHDLEGSTYADFNADAQVPYWNFYSLADSPSQVSFCNNIYLLSGYNILGPSSGSQAGYYFYRTYSGGALAGTHNAVNILLTFQAIDGWTSTDYFQIQIDTATPINGMHFSSSVASTPLCGGTANDRQPIKLKIEAPHSASTLKLTFISQLNQISLYKSFGIRDILITPYNSDTTVTQSLCGIAPMTLSELFCACSTPKFYQNPVNSGTCYPCHYDCATCNGPYNYNCLTCRAGKYPIAGNQCSDCHPTCAQCTGSASNQCISCYEGDFLARNNTCVAPCDYPLIRSSNTTQEYCESPCYPNAIRWDRSCATSATGLCVYPLILETKSVIFPVCRYKCEVYQFLYWDQDCLAYCNFPLVNVTQFSRQFCTFPCDTAPYTAPNTILYWDGVCRSSCNFPLIPSVWKGKTFCHYPCTTSQYLYWNGSCLDTCNIPLQVRIDTDTKVVYCDFPCADTAVAYWDGSCDTACPAPPTLISEGSPMVRYYCTYQCEIDQFLYWDGTCSYACPPPLKYQYYKDRSFCDYPCLSNQYLFHDGNCLNSCDSPFTIRIQEGVKYCDLVCPGLQYLYWNGTCSDSCDSPLLPREESYGRFCDFPCSNTGDYLYWDGTCLPSCPLPYTGKTVGIVPRNFCEYVCNISSEYLYYNGTCGQACNAPFTIRVQDGLQYCDYPCTGIAPSIYLFWDGTCVSTCNSPRTIRQESTLWQFCEFPCSSSDMFLYWDGSCSDYCMSPLTNHTEGSGDNFRNFCDYQCNSGEYLYWDGTCSTTCISPLRSTTDKNKQFCEPPCSSVFEYFYPSDNSCQSGCESPSRIDQTASYPTCLPPITVVEEGWFVTHILTPPTGNQVTLTAVVKMTQYLRFLDINMSPRLQRFAASKGRPFFSLQSGLTMSDDMQDAFANSTLPPAFQTYGLNSNFVVNFWGDFISIAIVILTAFVAIVLDKASNMYDLQIFQEITGTLIYLFKWNIVIILISALLQDVILFSSLQFRTAYLVRDSQATLFSLLICIAVFTLSLAYVGSVCYMIYQSYCIASQAPQRVTTNRLEKFQAISQDYQILFRVRLCLPMIFASYLFEYPLAQMIMQMLINVSIILYLLTVKPLEKKINQIQLLVFESIALVINICLLIITIFDFKGMDLNDFGIFLGDVVIFCSFALNVSTIGFIAVKIMQEASIIRKSNPKDSTLLSKIAYLKLLAIPLQQTGMGFEEMIDKKDYLKAKNPVQVEKASITQQSSLKTIDVNTSMFIPLENKVDKIDDKELSSFVDNELLQRTTLYSQQDSYRDIIIKGASSQKKNLEFGETAPKKKVGSENTPLDDVLKVKSKFMRTGGQAFYRNSFTRTVSKDSILHNMEDSIMREQTEQL